MSASNRNENKPTARGGFLQRLRGQTIDQLCDKVVRASSEESVDLRVERVRTCLNKFIPALEKNESQPKEKYQDPLLNAGEVNHRKLVRTIAALIPTKEMWQYDPNHAKESIDLIAQIIGKCKVKTWDFECLVPESITQLYRRVKYVLPPGPRPTGSKWNIIRRAVLLGGIVKYMGTLNKDQAERRLGLLGTAAPLLYMCVRTNEKAEPLPEPKEAPRLVELLLNAKADPSLYDGAAILRSTRCKWTQCSALMRGHCDADILRLVNSNLKNDDSVARKISERKAASMNEIKNADNVILLAENEATKTHSSRIRAIKFDSTGTFLATACGDGYVRIYDEKLKEVGKKLVTSAEFVAPVLDIDWAPDNKHIAAACSDGRLRILSAEGDLISESPEHINPENGEIVAVYSTHFSKDSSKISTSSHDGILRIYSFPQLDQVITSEDLDDGLFVAQFSAKNDFIYTAWACGKIRILDVNTGSILKELHDPKASFCDVLGLPDEMLAATSGDGNISIYDLRTNTLLHKFSNFGSPVVSIALSGNEIVAATNDGKITTHICASWEHTGISKLPQHLCSLSSMAISSKNRTYAFGTMDGRVALMEASVARSLTMVNTRQNEPSKEDERKPSVLCREEYNSTPTTVVPHSSHIILEPMGTLENGTTNYGWRLGADQDGFPIVLEAISRGEARVDIRAGDRILSINDESCPTFATAKSILKKFDNQRLDVIVVRVIALQFLSQVYLIAYLGSHS
eukprot:m.55039 g.55039  ORF g.55039 m.55039 type:complete len:744 (-) comp10962_c0_seq7:208-2439(-)